MITEAQLTSAINAILEMSTDNEKLGEILKSESFICYGEDITNELLKVLKAVFQDEGDWITYYLYETNCGTDFEEPFCFEVDGTPIPLKTVSDLYLLLINNMEDSNG